MRRTSGTSASGARRLLTTRSFGVKNDEPSVGDLLIGQIDLRLARALQTADADIADDADDSAGLEGEEEPPSDGIESRPVPPDE